MPPPPSSCTPQARHVWANTPEAERRTFVGSALARDVCRTCGAPERFHVWVCEACGQPLAWRAGQGLARAAPALHDDAGAVLWCPDAPPAAGAHVAALVCPCGVARIPLLEADATEAVEALAKMGLPLYFYCKACRTPVEHFDRVAWPDAEPELSTARYKCDHCGREADVLVGDPALADPTAGVCNFPIDRSAWKTVAPRESYVGRRADGQEICLGTMHPIEEYAG